VDEHPDLMAEHVLMVPNVRNLPREGNSNETDGLLEI
jgi:hypothetical protein